MIKSHTTRNSFLKRKMIYSMIVIFFILGNVKAHDDHHKDLRHWEIASNDPDRIFLSFCGDPTSTKAVTWRTSGSETLRGYAEIGKAQGGPGFINTVERIKAKTEKIDLNKSKKNKQGIVKYHSVIFKDLEPDTMYAYRVGDGNKHWSEWIQFRTASIEAKPFEFVYFGDAQNHILSHWSRTIRMANKVAPNAAFALHAGDLINGAHTDAEWAEWFKAGGFLHSQWSGIPVAGNHEYNPRTKLSMQWRPQFTLPVESELPERLHETVYTVEYQGMQVIVLNSNELIEEQTNYLKKQLEKKGFRWRVVTYHHSMYAPRRGITASSDLMEKEWKPLFEQYDVDMVLQGHDHAYTRSQSLVKKEKTFVKDSFQTIYITSVSGPKQGAIIDEHLEDFAERGISTIRKGEQTQFFQVISSDGNKLQYNAYTSTGELYDSATIIKDFKSGEKKIRQDIPNVKEKTFENTPGTKDSHK